MTTKFTSRSSQEAAKCTYIWMVPGSDPGQGNGYRDYCLSLQADGVSKYMSVTFPVFTIHLSFRPTLSDLSVG